MEAHARFASLLLVAFSSSTNIREPGQDSSCSRKGCKIETG
jgi:hypothetical protein